jgi:hypothetical protein
MREYRQSLTGSRRALRRAYLRRRGRRIGDLLVSPGDAEGCPSSYDASLPETCFAEPAVLRAGPHGVLLSAELGCASGSARATAARTSPGCRQLNRHQPASMSGRKAEGSAACSRHLVRATRNRRPEPGADSCSRYRRRPVGDLRFGDIPSASIRRSAVARCRVCPERRVGVVRGGRTLMGERGSALRLREGGPERSHCLQRARAPTRPSGWSSRVVEASTSVAPWNAGVVALVGRVVDARPPTIGRAARPVGGASSSLRQPGRDRWAPLAAPTVPRRPTASRSMRTRPCGWSDRCSSVQRMI